MLSTDVSTQEIILRALPPPPAIVADIGGGPGRSPRRPGTARALERVPELLGTGPHLIATAQRTRR